MKKFLFCILIIFSIGITFNIEHAFAYPKEHIHTFYDVNGNEICKTENNYQNFLIFNGNGIEFRKPNSTYAKNEWVLWSFNDSGRETRHSWMYFDENGYCLKGWRQINGNWYYGGYYQDDDLVGVVQGEIVNIDGNSYGFDSNGIMQTGWFQIDPIKYQTSNDLVSYNDKMDNSWYYADSSGKILKDTTTPDGYKVDRNGKCIE